MWKLSLYSHDAGCWGILLFQQQIARLEFNHNSLEECRKTLIIPTPLLLKEQATGNFDLTNLHELGPSVGNKKNARLICDFLSGKKVSFSEMKLYEYHCWSKLKSRVMHLTKNIPFGETMTYAELATAAGAPGAARAVGSIMATNPYPLIVPCHRVVGSGGKLGGYSAPGGLDTKIHLLQLEQVLHTTYAGK